MTFINYPQPTVGGYVLPSVPSISSVTSARRITDFNPLSLVEAFKPKRAGKNKNLAHVVVVLDDSSSMQSCLEATISGFNEFIAGQKTDAKQSGIKTLVSLFKFNGSHVTCVFDRQDVETVEPLTKKTYNPSGNTNLLDAMGGVLMKINELLTAKNKADRESVIVTVLTDGEENASRTFKNTDIKGMVEKAQGKSWAFMFLGANIDAFSTSSSLGFSTHNTMQYDTRNIASTMASASRMANSLKSELSKGVSLDLAYAQTSFTDAERSAAVAKNDK